MTKIKFLKLNNNFVGFECSGHTGFEEYGRDILCATISGITQSIVLGLINVCKIDVKLIKDENVGYLKVELPDNLNQNKLKQSQILFETLFESVKDLVSGYSSYISMEVIENVY